MSARVLALFAAYCVGAVVTVVVLAWLSADAEEAVITGVLWPICLISVVTVVAISYVLDGCNWLSKRGDAYRARRAALTRRDP